MKGRTCPYTIIILITTLLSSGCSSIHKDINKRYLPIAMGITKVENGNFKVALRIPQPGEDTTKILEAESKTISKAIDNMRTKSELDIDLLHIKLIFVSENIAKNGISHVLDYAFRSREITPKVLLTIISGDFVSFFYDKRKTNAGSLGIDFFRKEAGWTSQISQSPLWRNYRNVYSETEDGIIPIVAKGTDTLFDIKGSGVMHGDRMVGQISSEETFYFNLLKNQSTGGIIEVQSSTSVVIVGCSVTHHVSWINAPKAASTIQLTVVLDQELVNMSKPDLQTELEKLLQKKFNSLLVKLQTFDSDILGFGQYFRNIMTEEQRNSWKAEWYPKLEHELKIKVTIRDNGNLK
ncbi:Ger(x)C family spore germination C-terminal domain-containing protein [Paenibacillus sp. N3.4]|uniref:Ger(x)C family spore germination protein n=1 Tax=Paenibacillus sp. N3.4 TaxID=2603222 RepID=UPI0011CB8399|nr:Ger(x)C family spore germination C-terminal domain-containing protein [Paenibacillus sp. N3.4]TXK83733.1 hypothetical protein FU659_12545 [Paenibacillus sp. N3.4]